MNECFYIHHNNPHFQEMSTRTVNILMFYEINTFYELKNAFIHDPDFLKSIRKEPHCNGRVINELKTFAKENHLCRMNK